MEINLKKALPGHHHPIYALEIEQADSENPKGHESVKYFFSAGNDKGIVVWDLHNWSFEKVLYPLQHSVYALRHLANLNLLLAGDRSGQLHIICLSDQSKNQIIKVSDKPIFDIQYSKQDGLIFVSSEDGFLRVFSVDTWECTDFILLSNGAIRCISIHNSEKIVAAGTREGSVVIYNYAERRILNTISVNSMIVTSLNFNPQGDKLYCAGRDSHLRIFDWRNVEKLNEFVPHLYAVYKIAFHPNKPYYATASRDKDVKIWSITDNRLIKSISLQKGLPAHRLSVNGIAWTADGNNLISISDDRMILIWDVDFDNQEL